MRRWMLGLAALLALGCVTGCENYEPDTQTSPPATTSVDTATLKPGEYAKPPGTRTKPAGEKNVKDGHR